MNPAPTDQYVRVTMLLFCSLLTVLTVVSSNGKVLYVIAALIILCIVLCLKSWFPKSGGFILKHAVQYTCTRARWGLARLRLHIDGTTECFKKKLGTFGDLQKLLICRDSKE